MPGLLSDVNNLHQTSISLLWREDLGEALGDRYIQHQNVFDLKVTFLFHTIHTELKNLYSVCITDIEIYFTFPDFDLIIQIVF